MKAASLNHVYRLVWSKFQQAWIAVAETTRAHGKSNVNGQVVKKPAANGKLDASLTSSTKWRFVVASAFAAAIMPLSSIADTNVVAGVVAGDLTVKDVSATHTQYIHTANVNIVDFYKFGVMKGHQLDVIMPDAGRALYRVIGNSRSEINGTLNSNGSLFLVNQNGILFGKGAEVNVGNIVASTLGISNEAFLQGNYKFTAENMAGNVENRGLIKTQDEGYIVMLGRKVENSGTLVANNGSVVLASAKEAVLDFYGNGLVRANLTAQAVDGLVKNSGLIQANGGLVQLATNARSAAINISGIVEANQLVERDGMIRLEGGDNAKVEVSGQLIAQGEGTTGGSIEVTGEQVALMNGALLDASGDTGGGKVLVGGDYQGKNDAVYNARTTYVASGAVIKADARQQGDGGKVVVWANDLTRYYGSISAQGGAVSGNGGFVEVSGKQDLAFLGVVNVAAANGLGGSVLLDPETINLISGGSTPADNASGTPDVAFADNAGGTTNINVAGITGFSQLFLQATEDINVNAAVTMNVDGNIRFEANNNINVNAALTTSGKGSINLKADADNSGDGNLHIGANITGPGGVVLSAATLTHSAGNISTNGDFKGSGHAGSVKITVAGSAKLGTANITANGRPASSTTNGYNGGSVVIEAGSLEMDGNINTSGSASGTPGTGTSAVPFGTGGTGGKVAISTTGDAKVGNITTGAGNAGRNSIVSTASGEVSVKSTSGDVSVGNVTTKGGFNAIGNKVTLSADAGTVTAGNIDTSAGIGRANTDGKSAGAVNITAAKGITVQAITASGADGNGTNKSGGAAGAVTLKTTAVDSDINFGAITVEGGDKTGAGITGNGARILVQAVRDVRMNGDITSNRNEVPADVDKAVQLVAGRNFINNAIPGGHTIKFNDGATGRWTIYSSSPVGDVKGSNLLATYDYKQYGTSFGGKLLAKGNGFVHQVSPTLTATLTGSATKPFDGNNIVTDPSGLSVEVTSSTPGSAVLSTSTIDPVVDDVDVVTVSPITGATYDTPVIGTGKPINGTYNVVSIVTAQGKQIYNPTAGTVNGYAVNQNSTATGSITDPTSPRDAAGLGGLIPNNPILNTMFIVSLNPAAGDEEDLDAVACPTNEDRLGSTPILSSGVKLPDGVNSNCI